MVKVGYRFSRAEWKASGVTYSRSPSHILDTNQLKAATESLSLGNYKKREKKSRFLLGADSAFKWEHNRKIYAGTV